MALINQLASEEELSLPQPHDMVLEAPKKPRFGPIAKRLLLILAVFALLGVVAGVFGWIFIGIPAKDIYSEAQKTYQMAVEVKNGIKEQDLAKVLASLEKTKAQLSVTETKFSRIYWAKSLPVVGGYLSDARHGLNAAKYGLEAGEVTAKAVEPYADLLGLKGKGTFSGGTTEDRISKAIATLEKVTPQIDVVTEKVAALGGEINQIDEKRYPTNFQGKNIRDQILSTKSLIAELTMFLQEAKPLVKVLPKQLGQPNEVKYLFLFQNDAELRPTGGFSTAYAVFRVSQGRINIDMADDIYKLDAKVTKNVVPPSPITKYLKENVWHIRNANFSPDFPTSMANFLTLYNSTPDKKKIDGIVAVDTQFLVKILDVLGPITAYGMNFTTEKVPQCDCPMVIWELEKFADEPKPYLRESRKDIIGVLLSSMMQKAMKAPKQVWEPLFQTAIKGMREKHLLVYLLDQDAQKGVAAIGAAGSIKDYSGDYLHINDANLGGAKSNMYITQLVKQDTTVTTQGTETNMTIEYRHTRRGDNCSLERKEGVCLSGTLRDYLRVYLPKGSEVLEARGFESKSEVFDELGKTVVDGFFTVSPLGIARIQIRYKTSVKFTGEYRQLIQKQPGTVGNHYKVTVNGKVSEFDLLEDKEVAIKL